MVHINASEINVVTSYKCAKYLQLFAAIATQEYGHYCHCIKTHKYDSISVHDDCQL